jgi:hypothetical protein
MSDERSRGTSDVVAIILAAGIALALNIVVVALLWAAVQRLGIDVNSGISENGTQLLTGWGGGIIGVLGSYIGFTFGKKSNGSDPFLPGAPKPNPPPRPDPPGGVEHP